MIDNKFNGIFALLNNESKVASPSVRNFTTNVNRFWKSNPSLILSHKKNIEEGFSIRHFAGEVFYDTVNGTFND